jgi:hypothetical protein
MSRGDKFASQPISDALIDELADLLYEAAIRSSNPREDIRRIVGDFLEGYIDADKILCSVCKETKTDYIRQQWQGRDLLVSTISSNSRRAPSTSSKYALEIINVHTGDASSSEPPLRAVEHVRVISPVPSRLRAACGFVHPRYRSAG